MQRTNTFDVGPRSVRERRLLVELLDASAACYNEVTYESRQAYFEARRDDSDNRRPLSELRAAVSTAVYEEAYRQRYIQTLSSSTPQQLVQKNWDAWTSFFRLLGKYRDPADDAVTEKPSPPGYWKDDYTRRLHTVIRNEQYTLELGERSRLEIPVGMALKEQYGLGHNERLRLEVRGRPHWEGPQGRLELVYDRDAESFTAYQPVGSEESPPRRRDRSQTSLASTPGGDGVVAAVDIGANTLAAVTTSDGDQVRFDGRPLFERYRTQTEEIARLQSKLACGEWSSRRIRALYRRRQDQRDHAVDALIRHLAEWLLARGVTTLYVGQLDDVLRTHWSCVVNEMTHQFWAHGQFRERVSDVLADEYGIGVREVSEAGTSSQCPACASEDVTRSGDLLHCHECGFEGHSDVAASANFLVAQLENLSRPMARPAVSGEDTTEKGHHQSVPRLQWDDHRWRRRDHAFETNEAPADRSTTPNGKLASGGPGSGADLA